MLSFNIGNPFVLLEDINGWQSVLHNSNRQLAKVITLRYQKESDSNLR